MRPGLAAIVCLGVTCIGSWSTALAFVGNEGGALGALVRAPPAPAPEQGLELLAPEHPAVAALARQAGGAWSVWVDGRTRRLRRAFGPGIALTPAEIADLAASADRRQALASIGRRLIAQHAALFDGVDLDEWHASDEPEATPGSESGRLQAIRFTRTVAGVRVEPAAIVLVIAQGKLVYASAVGLDPIGVRPAPSLGAGETWAALVALAATLDLNLAPAQAVAEPDLALVVDPGGASGYRLVRRHTFRLPGRYETWRAAIDARTGRLLELVDQNRYLCSLDPDRLRGVVRGGVRPAGSRDAEEIRHFPFALVDDAGLPVSADLNGSFAYSGGEAVCDLAGAYFESRCTGCLPDPPHVSTRSREVLDFGVGGMDEMSNGFSTPADRAMAYHLNAARLLARKWTDLPALDAPLGSISNAVIGCNTYYSGTDIFTSRSALGCSNLGEVRDVVEHEWAHAVDERDGVAALNRALGESYGDQIVLMIDHNGCVGESSTLTPSGSPYCVDLPGCGVLGTCDGARNLDEARSPSGLMSVATAPTKCGTRSCGLTPLGLECHCEGEIYGQAVYHLILDLLTGTSYDTGAALPGANPALPERAAWHTFERIFFGAASLMASYAPSRLQSIGTSAYDAYLLADDDNADLTDGTPHAAYINDAFAHHGIEELPPLGDSANCTPLPDPASAATVALDPVTGVPEVVLSWGDVDAVEYAVYRNFKLSDAWLPVAPPIADSDATGYSIADGPLPVGSRPNYVVMALGPAGCTSAGASLHMPVVAVADVAVAVGELIDPPPGGDGDGLPEPGELVELRLDLAEVAGLAGLSGVEVELVSREPLATVTAAGPFAYGDLLPSGSLPGPARFAVDISAAHDCPAALPLVALITASDGCLMRAFSLEISSGCSAPPPLTAVAGLRLFKPAAGAEARATWLPAAGDGYHVWSVEAARDLDAARAGGPGGTLVCDAPAAAACDLPAPEPGSGSITFYQVRAVRGGSEGP